MSTRKKERIDYKKLHSTGEHCVIKNQKAVTQTQVNESEKSTQANQSEAIESITSLSTLIEGLTIQEQKSLQTSTMDQDQVKQLNIQKIVIANDVDDFLSENDFDDLSKSEVDMLTTKVETLRTNFEPSILI